MDEHRPSRRWLRWGAGLAVLALVGLRPWSPAPAATTTATVATQIEAANGMVASAHALASQAGLAMLKAGGNAVDAAVAAAFAVGVVEPNASGIGGEGMLILYRADRKTAVVIDYRSVAPAALPPGGLANPTGYRAVAVPGFVAGLALALEKYGTKSLREVLEPSIRLADEGFLIGPTLAASIVDTYKEIVDDEPLARLLTVDGLPLEAGATLRNPDLAATLRRIAAGGANAFYRGEIAARLVSEMKARGGLISGEDLARYRAVERAPIEARYRGHVLLTTPPPVGGIAVAQTLGILERFDLTRHRHDSPARVHLMAEAMRRAFADWSAFVGDPDHVDVPVAALLSRPYLAARASEIALDRVTPAVGAGDPTKVSSSTTSLSTVDRAGNMVALTQTISDFFGAKVAVAGTGIILNNEMRNFSARGPNTAAPGKRMRTTIAPTILLKDGRPLATLGTPGGGRIISTMALLLSNLIDDRMGIQEAIEAPRYYARDLAGQSPGTIEIEPRLPAATVAALTKMGYTVKELKAFDLYFGGAQGIVIDPRSRKRIGGADPRRDGSVVGY